MGKKRVAQIEEGAHEAPKAAKEASEYKATSDKKKERVISHARIYVNATYNNVMVNVTNEKGDVLAWASSGNAGFQGPRRATPYASSRVIEMLMEKLGKTELGDVDIFVKGIGAGRDAAIRALAGKGLKISSLKDVTPVPHGGVRARKPRRV